MNKVIIGAIGTVGFIGAVYGLALFVAATAALLQWLFVN